MVTAIRPFRFGVIATPEGGGKQWLATARRVSERGYSTLLMPDGLQLPSPFPALAMAAAAATDLRVGTFVVAAPLRPPRSAAWEAHSLSVLTDGRFDFGIGSGRPAAEGFAAELGLPWGSADERLRQVRRAVEDLRQLDGDRHTPVLMAAKGPKARSLAAELADIVTLAADTLATRDEVSAMAADVRALAGDRADAIELAMPLFVVGDQATPWTERFIGADVDTLIKHDSLFILRGTPREMAGELTRRRDAFGVSYITVGTAFFELFAPVVEILAGR